MKTKSIYFLLLLIFVFQTFAYAATPIREFRGAWIAVVRHEDWPSEFGLSSEEQMQEFKLLLDELQSKNINAVFFHIRPECDAVYQSNFEPWSYWLTGEQGKAPEPFYDPLQFAIDEAHKRGMELHAWFNPYRTKKNSDDYQVDDNYITKQHPEWTIGIGNYNFLNPGIPEVREYTIDVILDVVENYNIDGIHLDDYFYPYPPSQITIQDTVTFNKYPRGITNIEDWRRDNVSLLIEMIGDSVLAYKPYLKYGISPFGIWKNGVPEGIVGLDAYNVIYCDPVYWMSEQLVDYVIPQLYWPFGGQQDYGTLLPWWAEQNNKNRHLYAGMGLYKSYSPSEYGNEINLNRSEENVQGGVFFKASNFLSNKAVGEYLLNNQYKYKAIPPSMDWKDITIPIAPTNIRFEALEDERGDGLKWDIPLTGDPFMYAVYLFNSTDGDTSYINNSEKLVAVSGTNYVKIPKLPEGSSDYYFGITSLSRNYIQSPISEIIQVNLSIPEKTVLDYPGNGAINQPEKVILKWIQSPHASLSSIQIALDEEFTNIVFEKEEIRDTFIVASKFTGQTEYYWRVNSSNFVGEGELSDVWSFKTGFPIPPILDKPFDKNTGISIKPTFNWESTFSATEYRLQVSLGTTISTFNIKIDTVITDTICQVTTALSNNRVYSWHVSSSNSLGFGGWSEPSVFKTEATTDVDEYNAIPKQYSLSQNYPNPFNPSTTISYGLPFESRVKVEIFNILGQRVKTITNQVERAGLHTALWDAKHLASGIYIIRINATSLNNNANFIKSIKMTLLK